MKIKVWDKLLEEAVEGEINQVRTSIELPKYENGWKFDWQTIFNTQPETFSYKLTLISTKSQVEGIVIFSLKMNEMLFMHNLEVAPHNFGSQGRYRKVAGCLIAYGCSLSLNLGKGNYWGYLNFKSKTELMELYMKEYGASIAFGQNMYFDPIAGMKLIKDYLGLDYRLKFEDQ